jgi:hypothetical protein
MKKLIGLTIVLVLGGVGLLVYAHTLDISHKAVIDKAEEAKAEIDVLNGYIAQINKAGTVAELELLERHVPKFGSDDTQKKIKGTLGLKKAKLEFMEAEALLARAIDLQQALTLPPLPPEPAPMPMTDTGHGGYNPTPPPQPQPPPPPPIHPAAQAALEKAEKLYISSKKQIDKLNDIAGDKDYNFSLNYTKGEIYHRHLMFLSTQENQQELFTQTAMHYKKALTYRPGDTNTIVNIELLLKQAQGGGGQGQSQPQRMLNQMGVGKSKGN